MSDKTNSQAPKATIGRIVIYKVSETDSELISAQRNARNDVHSRVAGEVGLHAGNESSEGNEYPMMIVANWGDSVNGQVFLDGNDTFWATSVSEGDAPGQWHWPTRKAEQSTAA